MTIKRKLKNNWTEQMLTILHNTILQNLFFSRKKFEYHASKLPHLRKEYTFK